MLAYRACFPPHRARSSLLTASCIALVLRRWAQEHYDVRNSGSSIYSGPGDTQGFCRSTIVKTPPPAGGFGIALTYSSSGVTADSQTAAWFGGGSDDVLNIGQLYGLDNVQLTPINLETYWKRPSPAALYGLVASGVSWEYDIGDSHAITSSDGHT